MKPSQCRKTEPKVFQQPQPGQESVRCCNFTRAGALLLGILPKVRKRRNGTGRLILACALLCATTQETVPAAEAQGQNEARNALGAQRRALTEAVARRDAAGVAKIFTTDAKLMLPGLETVTGREAIQKFWQAGLSGGFVKGISLTPADVTGENDGLLAETGTLATLDDDGKEKEQSRYLILWKREGAEWRIHRDIANSEFAPAPKADRVGFSKDYRTTFKRLGVPTRTNTAPSIVTTAYGNDLAASVTKAQQLPYPNGSIIVMEFAKALTDSEGKPLLDVKHQPQQGEVQHVDVMRRGEGFGEAYGANRSGQWEFAGYFLDGTYSTTPAKSASCAQCHQKAGPAKDFVFPLDAEKSTMHSD